MNIKLIKSNRLEENKILNFEYLLANEMCDKIQVPYEVIKEFVKVEILNVEGYFLKTDNNKGIEVSIWYVLNISGEIVGRLDIRHNLDSFLLKQGGNIGFSVLASWRNKGIGSELLKFAIGECKQRAMERVLLVCTSNNIASRKIIMRQGGILENKHNIHGEIFERYWIEC